MKKIIKKIAIVLVFGLYVLPGAVNADTSIYGGYDYDMSYGGYDYNTSYGGYDYDTTYGGYDYDTTYGGYDYDMSYGGYDYDTTYGGYDYDTTYGGYDYDTTYGGYDYSTNYGGYDYNTLSYGNEYFGQSAYYPQDYYSAYQDYYSYDSGYNNNSGCTSNCNSNPPPRCTSNCNNPPKPPKAPNPPKDNLDVICIVSDRTIKKGDSVTFTAQVDGGNGPFAFQWSGDVSGSDRKITRQFTNAGTYQASVRVIDQKGRTATANCDTVVVEKKPIQNNDLDLICIVSDRTIEEGDSVTFTAQVDGGNSPFTYQWSGDVSGSSRTITERFNSEGNYQAFVRVTDQNGRTATADCDVEVEDEDEDEDDFDAICRVSDSSIEEGDTVRFTAEVDGGNSPFDYDWSGDIDDENDQSFSVRFNSEGEYDIDLEVTDDDGRTARDTCTVRVEEEDEDDDDDRDINVTTDRPDFDNLSSIGSVYLNQVPYTGPEDAAKGIAFGVGILAWSIAGALIIRKKMNKNSVSSRIEAFKNANRTTKV